MSKPILFGEANKEIELLSQETCSRRALTLLAIVASTLFPCKLESGENVTVHNPQQLLQRLGYD